MILERDESGIGDIGTPKVEHRKTLLLGLFDEKGVLHHVGVTSAFSMATRRQLTEELKPLRVNALEKHPWRQWADAESHHGTRMPGGQSRWSAGKDLSWEPLRAEREFQRVLAQDILLRLQADRTSSMRYEVVTPVGYSPKESYPLFIVLHAGGDDMRNARRYWWSDELGNFVTVYVQSFRHLTSSTFTWMQGDPQSRAALRRIYRKVVGHYSVDPRRVLIGGMSAGGMMSLDVVLRDVLPVTGFVVNCPVVPNDLDPEMAADMRRRGIRGVILTGERDFSLQDQKALVEALTRARVPVRLTIIPGQGHAIPADFPTRLDAALVSLTEPPPPVRD